MAKRLGTKHKKLSRKTAAAYKKGLGPKKHKVAETRSRRAKKKKAFTSY
ncbi:MAG: hypothetical protein AABZ06_10435 [Bdellovibrionota bacterium]